MIFHRYEQKSFLFLFDFLPRKGQRKFFNKKFLEIDKIVSERKLSSSMSSSASKDLLLTKLEKGREQGINNIVFYYLNSSSVDVCFACTYEFLTIFLITKALSNSAAVLKEEKPHFILSIIV